MKANKDHISLETAKLLKDCGVESECVWIHHHFATFEQKPKLQEGWSVRKGTSLRVMSNELLPAFTWGEILWERAKEFFGSELIEFRYEDGDELYDFLGGDLRYPYSEGACMEFTCKEYSYRAFEITLLLQEANYEGADLYFREHCILIK